MRIECSVGAVHLDEIGEGASLLLLHPLPGDGRFFGALAGELGASHRLLVPDLPGNGRSEKPRADYSLEGQCAAVLELLDARDVERVTLVGASYGGILGLYLAERFPARLDALVLTGMNAYTSFRFPLGARLMSSSAGRWLVPFANRRAVVGSYAEHFHDRSSIDPRHFDELWEPFHDPAARFSLWKQAHEIDFSEVEPRLGEVETPTLLVWGAQDRASPLEWARRLERDLPDARLAVLERCGHYPPIEQPAAFAAALGDFLDTLER